MNKKYSPEMRERALRMLAETRPSHPTMMSAVRHVAGLLGMSPETLRLWQRGLCHNGAELFGLAPGRFALGWDREAFVCAALLCLLAG